ncbi:GMC oxidoreductase [Hyphomonas sp.]|uniref:GMC oxidoreductase n=1 Tax=Hyphomonas sp. TaxID=87 RepID=UPI00349FDB55
MHDVENLYIVENSTFPTSGWANPTLTLVAPALRTNGQISAELNKERVAHAS